MLHNIAKKLSYRLEKRASVSCFRLILMLLLTKIWPFEFSYKYVTFGIFTKPTCTMHIIGFDDWKAVRHFMSRDI